MKRPYTEKDITLPTKGKRDKNVVKVKGKQVGWWIVTTDCYFDPFPDSGLEDFDARSIVGLKIGLLSQLNKTLQTHD